MIVQNMSPGTK